MYTHAHAHLQVLTWNSCITWDGLKKEPVEELSEWGWFRATDW